ncbi:MAG: DUF3015 domain-containing protein [Proteobacteria bacterium]|nr:DUF3015 domain-containing protein [Pseudomonadota bacterium]
MAVFKSTLFFLVLMVLSLSLYARDTSSGCGIGWEINDDNSFLGTTTRGTTHSTFNPSFSMTSGTSGCARHSIVKNEAKGIHYAEANYANLMTEMSLGNGEFLSGFAHVLGCGDVENTFKDVMQKNYGNIYSSDDVAPVEMYNNVIRQIEEDSQLSGSCRSI